MDMVTAARTKKYLRNVRWKELMSLGIIAANYGTNECGTGAQGRVKGSH